MDDAKKVIILHDDPIKRSRLKQVVADAGHTSYCFENITICLDNFGILAPELVLIGPFSLEKTSRFINFVKTVDLGMPLMLIDADNALRDFVSSNRFDNVAFGRDATHLQEIKKKIDELPRNQEKEEAITAPLIVGNSPEIIRLRKLCFQVSRSDENVLIVGENGTGKDLIARTLHQWSHRRHQPIIKINVEAMSGHGQERKRASETIERDAVDNRLNGIIEILKDRTPGTLFIDGIEHLPLPFQARLESVLKEGGQSLVRNKKNEAKGISIISAAGRNLETLVGNGQFSKALSYLLSVFEIEIPPLRKHPEDIPILVDYLADMYCRQRSNGMYKVSDKTKKLLQDYSWPGNFTELENLVKKFIDTGFSEKTIEKFMVDKHAHRSRSHRQGTAGETGLEELDHALAKPKNISMKAICKQVVAKTEKKLIKGALQHNNWNRKRAARMLDISYRSLLNKIKEYRLMNS